MQPSSTFKVVTSKNRKLLSQSFQLANSHYFEYEKLIHGLNQ